MNSESVEHRLYRGADVTLPEWKARIQVALLSSPPSNCSDLPDAFGSSDDLVQESAAVSPLLAPAGMPVGVIAPDTFQQVENSPIPDTLLNVLTVPPKPRGHVVCCRKALRVLCSLSSVSGSLTSPDGSCWVLGGWSMASSGGVLPLLAPAEALGMHLKLREEGTVFVPFSTRPWAPGPVRGTSSSSFSIH